MTPGGFERRARTARRLLERARARLARGEFDGLAALSERTEAAAAALAAADPGESPRARAALEDIAEAAARNGRLIEAAMEGVARARASLRAGAEHRERLGYDQAGAALPTPGAPTRDHRA